MGDRALWSNWAAACSVGQRREPLHQRILRPWDEMYEVWPRLTPPTVNPGEGR
jgi:hypothetical protein